MNDYVDAAERHYLGATALQMTCMASASHSYGISAECFLKALMSNQQPQANPISKNHMSSSLWAQFSTSSALSANPTLVAAAKQFETCFATWDVHQRYFNRNHTAFAPVTVADQKKGAEGLKGLFQQVQQGLI